jgi:hypothetical protein
MNGEGEMKKNKTSAVVFFVVLIIILIVAVAYFYLKDSVLLGPSGSTEVSVTVGNSPPVIISTITIPNVNLNPAPSSTDVVFTFSARDPNGLGDLVDSSAFAQFTKAGEATRSNTCVLQFVGAGYKTYRCTVQMQYYDASGSWNVAVSISDVSGATASSSSTFTVNLLRDISLSPATINFPAVSPGQSNVLASDQTTITNNGNFVAPPGSILATSYDLSGETNPLEKIPAANFMAAGSLLATDVCTGGIALTSGTATGLTNAQLARGASGNTESLRYCLTLVPDVSSQVYSASGGNSWVIAIS